MSSKRKTKLFPEVTPEIAWHRREEIRRWVRYIRLCESVAAKEMNEEKDEVRKKCIWYRWNAFNDLADSMEYKFFGSIESDLAFDPIGRDHGWLQGGALPNPFPYPTDKQIEEYKKMIGYNFPARTLENMKRLAEDLGAQIEKMEGENRDGMKFYDES